MSIDVSEAVKAIRELRGMSISELARRAGLSKATVSDIEANANRSPGLDTLVRIADALDVHVATLMGVDGPGGSGEVREVDAETAATLIAEHGFRFATTRAEPTRFFIVGRGFSLHAVRLHPGDILATVATGEPTMPGAVVIENKAGPNMYEARLFLDPYLIGPDCEGILRQDMKQSPNLKIVGRIATRIGSLS